MTSKEVMVSAPLIVLLYDRTFLAGSFRAAWRQRRGLADHQQGRVAVEPALVGPDSVTVARARTLREREFTLLTAWPDGGYVLTRCPRRGLLTTRNSASCSLRSASSGAEALSVHAAAVRDFAHSHGQPMEARDTAAVDECYRTAARTWQRELIRTNVVAIPIGLLGCATVIVAVLAR